MKTDNRWKFDLGDTVKVREGTPDWHHRTPWYLKGKTGRVATLCGLFHNPEFRAYGISDHLAQPLYRIEFDQIYLWPGYTGQSQDKLHADIYQHWLQHV